MLKHSMHSVAIAILLNSFAWSIPTWWCYAIAIAINAAGSASIWLTTTRHRQLLPGNTVKRSDLDTDINTRADLVRVLKPVALIIIWVCSAGYCRRIARTWYWSTNTDRIAYDYIDAVAVVDEWTTTFTPFRLDIQSICTYTNQQSAHTKTTLRKHEIKQHPHAQQQQKLPPFLTSEITSQHICGMLMSAHSNRNATVNDNHMHTNMHTHDV